VNAVPLLDLKRLDAELRARIEEAFQRVLKSGHFILGPETEVFEREVAAYLGVPHAVSISSGTDALLIALMALEIKPGAEVIVPAYTFFATGGCVSRLGAKPVFVDCDPLTFNVEARHIERALTPRTKAVLPVHLFGQCADLGPIEELCAQRGLALVEDAAQAIGAQYRGKSAGNFGQIGCYSFYPTKNLGALGDGGLVVTKDAALADKLKILRGHGMRPKYYHALVGGNFRLDEMQCAFLRAKLPYLERWNEARRKNAAQYRVELKAAGLLDGRLTAPAELPNVRHIYNQFVVRVAGGKRDALRAFLAERKIGTEIYYPVPLHLQECFANLGGKAGQLPESEKAAAETVALPMFPELSAEELSAVVAALKAFFQ